MRGSITRRNPAFRYTVNTAGTGTQTTLNRELVYNYITNEWYDVYKRASPLACGKFLVNSNGEKVTYGGDYAGYVHKLNTGTADNTTAIDYYLVTGTFSPWRANGRLQLHNPVRSLKIKGSPERPGPWS